MTLLRSIASKGKDTIFALATAKGKAGVGVIRISGPDAKHAINSLLDGKAYERIISKSRMLHRCRLEEGKRIIDEAMAVYFKGPFTFTGEDVIELHIHSSRAVIGALYRVLQGHCRIAEPGEFTQRAFANGKLDMAQVEGLADLIEAETEGQRRLAMQQLSGRSSARLWQWREELISALAMCEAWIDFAEDEQIENDTLDRVYSMVEIVMEGMQAELARGASGQIVRNGLRVALIGAPNAGKSSILNQLGNSSFCFSVCSAARSSNCQSSSWDHAGCHRGDHGLGRSTRDHRGHRWAS